MTDLIVASIKDYGWDQIRTFVVSVDRSGFKGDKVMFVDSVTAEALNALYFFGWKTIVACETHKYSGQDFSTARYIPVTEYLKKNEFRYVIWCDTRDQILQSDPVIWLEKNLGSAELVAASECVRLRDQSTNYGWIQKTLGNDIAVSLGDYEVLCAGTIVGRGKTVTRLFEEICRLSRQLSGGGYDQPYLNYLLRTPAFRDVTIIPRMKEGFIATCSWFLSWPRIWENLRVDESPDFDLPSATVYIPGTREPFCILHQYDRDGEWDKAIRRKYA